MSTSAPSPATLSEPLGARGPLRIVLLGLPGAGKSALLAALAQVQREYASQMLGELTDHSGGLAEQRRLFYEEIGRPTETETQAYPIRFRPVNRRPRQFEAVIIDCDGRVVQEMLDPMVDRVGTLSEALADADAVILVLDAARPAKDNETTVVQFGQYLRRLEEQRGARNEVTGLPVFAVLTKCDLLAQRQWKPADWVAQIAQWKRWLGGCLQKTMSPPGQVRPREFGRLDIRLWATATRQPPLVGQPAEPRAPVGVAELFRLVFTEARAFRSRRRRAGRRLLWAFGGTSGLAMSLLALTTLLLTGLGREVPNELEQRIERYRLGEGTALSARLNDWPPSLKRRLEELGEIQDDPHFAELRPDLQTFVQERRLELLEYLPYLEKVLQTQFPSIARNDEQLVKRQAELEERLTLPRPDWEETGAGILRRQRLADLGFLRDRADEAERWYQRLRAEGIDLWTFRKPPRLGSLINWRAWQDATERYLRSAEQAPPAVERIPSASLVTPNIILQFTRVHDSRELMQSGVRDLETIQEIAAALGLIEPTLARPELLAIPRPGRFSAEEARERYDRLRNHPQLPVSLVGLTASDLGGVLVAGTFFPGHPLVSPYPHHASTFVLERIPDAARPAIIQSATNNHQYLLVPLRDQVQNQSQPLMRQGESRTAWLTLANWLTGDPPTLLGYRRLATVLARLSRTVGRDPVEELATFLRAESFPFSMRGATVLIPFDWEVQPPEDAALVFTVGKQTFAYLPDLRGIKRDPQSRVTSYPFRGSLQRLTYRPGEPFSVTLMLRGDRQLTWQDARTASYAFECLSLPPRLHRRSETADRGTRAESIFLRPDFDQPLPDVPDILPALIPGTDR